MAYSCGTGIKYIMRKRKKSIVMIIQYYFYAFQRARVLNICFVALIVSTGFYGCKGTQAVIPARRTWTLDEIIENHNQNISAIPGFKATVGDWQAQWLDEEGKKQSQKHMGGRLFFQPAEIDERSVSFNLRTNTLMREALVIGANESEYWMYIKPVIKQGWWGKKEHLGKECVKNMLINPNLLLEFIGWQRLPEETSNVTYKAHDKLIVEYLKAVEGKVQVTREYIFDRHNCHLIEINAYESDGSRIMRSTLSRYIKLGNAWLPGEIHLMSSIREFHFYLRLHKFKKDASIDPGLFTRPVKIRGIDDYEQIDQECE